MIHYHGLPLSPHELLFDLGGRHVCASFATCRGKQIETATRIMQSVMFDNGAFTLHRRGGALDYVAYYAWVRPWLSHPNWAVVPDVIDGSVEDQRALVATWPFDRSLGAPVWHLGLPLDYLVELASTWPRVCLGSSGAFWQVGGAAWRRRMDEAFDALAGLSVRPWVHGLRMMDQAGKRWPMASVDSVNVARNYKTREQMPGAMADRIDRVNGPFAPPPKWSALM